MSSDFEPITGILSVARRLRRAARREMACENEYGAESIKTKAFALFLLGPAVRHRPSRRCFNEKRRWLSNRRKHLRKRDVALAMARCYEAALNRAA